MRPPPTPELAPLYEALFEHGADGVFIGRPDGTIVRANPAACRLLGGTEAEIVAGGRARVVVQDAALEALLEQRRAHGVARGSLRYRRLDGTTFPVEITSALATDARGETFAYTIFRDVSEREVAARALAERDALVRAVFESIPDPLFVKDRESRWRLANPATLGVVERTEAQVIGRTDAEILGDARFAQAVRENDRRVIATGRPSVVEEVVPTPRGERLFVSTKVPFRDADGAIIGVIGHASDVTARRRAVELEALQRAIAHLPIGVVVVRLGDDGVTVVLAQNAAHAAIVGEELRRSTPLTRSGCELFLPDRRTTLAPGEWPGARAARMREPVNDLEIHVRRADGSWRVVSVSATPVDVGAADGERRAIVVLLDVTAQHEAAAQLRVSEAKFHALFEEAADACFVHDFEGRFREVNRRACESLGYGRDELLARGVADVEPALDLAWARLRWPDLEVGKPFTLHAMHRRKDGTTFPAELRLTRVGLRGESMIMALVRDATAQRSERERLRALTARVQAAREEEQARIARDLHDDLGQVLTALQLELQGAEELVERLPPSADAGAISDRLVAATELARATIGVVQRLTQDLKPTTLERLGLEAGLRQELRRFAERSGLEVTATLRVGREPPADVATALFRITQEALTNVARHAAARRVDVHLSGDDATLVLEVSDDGRGLPPGPHDASHLGLLGIHERARALGGEASVSRGAAGGTTVSVSVPRAAEGSA